MPLGSACFGQRAPCTQTASWGSTVMLLMPKGRLQWQESLVSGKVTQMGEVLWRLQ